MTRHRSTAPVLAFGVAPAEAERVVAAYSTATGARLEAKAKLLRVGDDLGQKVGARRGFAIFIAELGPDANVCRGITPRAFAPDGRRFSARRAVPPRRPLGLQDGGWVAGFTPTWGVGVGTRNVCGRSSPTGRKGSSELNAEAAPANPDRRITGEPDASSGMPWPVAAGVVGGLALIALVAVWRLKAGRQPTR
jgi:hypothetical protein